MVEPAVCHFLLKMCAQLHTFGRFRIIFKINNNFFSKILIILRSLIIRIQYMYSTCICSIVLTSKYLLYLTDLSSAEVEIPGYKFISSHRINNPCGGTGIYLQEHFEYSLCSDCNHSDPDAIESLFVEIHNPHGKNIVVGAIYRPPNQNTTAFLDIFNNILSKVSRKDKYCYLGGDYNLDLLRHSDHSPTQDFLNSIFFHFFLPLIHRPTRITAHSATLIDNIFTNHLDCNDGLNGIIVNDISDHLPVFVYTSLDSFSASNNKPSTISVRDFSEKNVSNFFVPIS